MIIHPSQNQLVPTRLEVAKAYGNIFHFIGIPLKLHKFPAHVALKFGSYGENKICEIIWFVVCKLTTIRLEV